MSGKNESHEEDVDDYLRYMVNIILNLLYSGQKNNMERSNI